MPASMLYIAVVFAIMAVLAIASIRKRLPYTAPYATGIAALVLAFLLGVMLFLANPLSSWRLSQWTARGSTRC